jgi:single-strand DNA-binding protein
MNRGSFWGYLTKDPEELKYYGDNARGKVFVAVRRRSKDKDGNYQSDFIPVVTWGKTAENCAKYLRKGSPVAVEYHIRTDSYDDDQGKRRFTLDIVADNIEFLPSKKDSGGAPDNAVQPAAPVTEADMIPVQVSTDDLPF